MKNLKKILILTFALITSLSIVSCKKDKEARKIEQPIFQYSYTVDDSDLKEISVLIDEKDNEDIYSVYKKLDNIKNEEECDCVKNAGIKLGDKVIAFDYPFEDKDEIEYKIYFLKGDEKIEKGRGMLKKGSEEFDIVEKYINLSFEKDKNLKDIVDKNKEKE